jgi:hypothetical protein
MLRLVGGILPGKKSFEMAYTEHRGSWKNERQGVGVKGKQMTILNFLWGKFADWNETDFVLSRQRSTYQIKKKITTNTSCIPCSYHSCLTTFVILKLGNS